MYPDPCSPCVEDEDDVIANGDRGPKFGVELGVLSNPVDDDENDMASGIGAGRPTIGVLLDGGGRIGGCGK